MIGLNDFELINSYCSYSKLFFLPLINAIEPVRNLKIY
jgi:hypothetical protein